MKKFLFILELIFIVFPFLFIAIISGYMDKDLKKVIEGVKKQNKL